MHTPRHCIHYYRLDTEMQAYECHLTSEPGNNNTTWQASCLDRHAAYTVTSMVGKPVGILWTCAELVVLRPLM
jgi:hypothetical protein